MDLTDSELADIADELDVDVSALQSQAVKDCAESVKADRDVSKSQAFAICQDMENQGLLAEPAHVALAEQRDPGAIERIEESDGTVRYTNVMLLAPGVWGDAASQRQFLYSENTTKTLADNIADTTLNLFHEQKNDTTEVGNLDKSSVYIGDSDAGLYGDLVLSMDNPASEFADQALQDALESRGNKGLKGPSLEIAQPDHEFNADAGVPEVTDGVITGVGLVGLGVSLGPGSKDVAFDKQTRQRAVALSSAEQSHVLYRTNDMTDTDRLLGALSEELSEEELREVAAERGIDLQEDDEEEETADDEDEEEMDEEQDEEEMDEDEEEEEEEEQDIDIDLADVAEQVNSMQEQVQSNAERIGSLAEATDGVDLGDMAEQVATLSDAIENKADAERVGDLAETVESVADTLKEPTSLAEMDGSENGSDGGDGPLVDFGHSAINKNY